MRSRMPVDLQRLRVLRRQDLQFGVFLERTSQVPKISVNARDHGVIGQSWANGFRDVQRAATGWNVLLAAIGQSNIEAFTHVTFRLSGNFSFAYSALAWCRIGIAAGFPNIR